MKNEKTYIIETCDSFLEQKKNEFLKAVYYQEYHTAEQAYIDILEYAERLFVFTENTEKLLNQIQTIFKKFRPDLLKHCTSKIKEINILLKNLILDSIRQSCKSISHVDFQTWETRLELDDQQRNLLFKTAMTFQLSSGCSHFCRRCNEWALPKVRSHFSYAAIQKIINHMIQQKNRDISLYGASDPLDWCEDEKTICDIIDYLEKLPIGYHILTKVPKGRQRLLKRLLEKKSNLSVSITSKNKTRIQKIEDELKATISKQHDLDELLIPARLDEDFVSIKPSITDGYGTEITPDGAFIIIPAFTSALHPFGHKKIRISSETNFFPIKKTGRESLLVDYFKPLEGYNLEHRPCCLNFLLDVQIESIILDNGTDELIPPGMRSLKEYFFIFGEPARLQRKKMSPSVLKKLKEQFISNSSFKNLSYKTRAVYLKNIHGHLDLCKKDNCLPSRLFAISFLLKSISSYVLKNPVKTKILQFLLKHEIEQIFNTQSRLMKDKSFEQIFMDPDLDPFEAFRFCIFCLLTQSENTAVLSFINTYPSAFDPIADIFVGR